MVRGPRIRVRLSELTDFLVETKTRLRGAEAAAAPTARAEARRQAYSRAPFRYAEDYLGDTVEIGREIVWYGDVPIWGMGCHGGIRREFAAMRHRVFAVLPQILATPDPVCPVRGPHRLDRDGFLYVNHLTGSLRSFVGREAVYWRDRVVCFYDYIGGEVSLTAPGAVIITG